MIKLSPIAGFTIAYSEKKEGNLPDERSTINYFQSFFSTDFFYFHHQHQAHRIIIPGRPLPTDQIGDSVISQAPHLGLAMRVADCLPLILIEPKHRIYSLIHAGAKPLGQNIIELTLIDLNRFFHVQPSQLHAWIGPGIRSCCYRTPDRPWQTDLPAWQTALKPLPTKEWQIDLPAFIQSQLTTLGVPAAQIIDSEICTGCQRETFFSHHCGSTAADRAGRFGFALIAD